MFLIKKKKFSFFALFFAFSSLLTLLSGGRERDGLSVLLTLVFIETISRDREKKKDQIWSFAVLSVHRSCLLAPHMGRLYVCQWLSGQDSQILGPACLHCHHCRAQPFRSVACTHSEAPPPPNPTCPNTDLLPLYL